MELDSQHDPAGSMLLTYPMKTLSGLVEEARKLAWHHHEKYDGTGYPDGLTGNEIPLGARLLAVADAYDSMTSNRSYRAAMSREDALSELHRCCGTQFCPVAVAAFVSGLESHLAGRHPDGLDR